MLTSRSSCELSFYYSIFVQALKFNHNFHQNKTEITSTITSDTDKVSSCAAVAAYVDYNISGAMDFTVTKAQVEDDVDNTTLSVANTEKGICIVRVTNLSDGSIQCKNNIFKGEPRNMTRAFTFQSMPKSANYMVEAWYYNSDTKKLIPTAVKFI